ncbi:hypothetical protein D3C75_1341280 [compost metagenome]
MQSERRVDNAKLVHLLFRRTALVENASRFSTLRTTGANAQRLLKPLPLGFASSAPTYFRYLAKNSVDRALASFAETAL